MKKIFALFLSFFLVSSFSTSYAQAPVEESKIKELILQDVNKQGLNKLPEVVNLIRDAQDSILIRVWEKTILASQPVTAEMKAQVYKELSALLGNSEYKVFQVFMDNEASAKALIKAMSSQSNWESLNIKTIVQENTKYSANKPDWVNISAILPEFRPVVTALKPGEVASKPIRVQSGWHVVGLIQTRPLKMPTPEQMDKELVNLAERKIVGLKIQSLLAK